MSRKQRKPVLVLTGEVKEGQCLVYVRGTAVRLGGTSFSTLCELFCARAKVEMGYVEVPRMRVARLRQGIDFVCQAASIVETCGVAGYWLAWELKDVGYKSNFRELPVGKLISQEVMRDIVRSCPEVRESVTGWLPDGVLDMRGGGCKLTVSISSRGLAA